MYIYIYACCVSKTSKVLVTHIMSIQPKNQKLYLGVERKWKILVIGQRYFNNQPQCTIEMSPQTIFSKASQKGAVQIATIFKGQRKCASAIYISQKEFAKSIISCNF